MSILNAYFNWSSGKDSAMALYHAQQDPRFEVRTLLTTVNQAHQRVSMHGIHVDLLDQQAQALGLPLEKIWLPEVVNMDEYEGLMHQAVDTMRQLGCEHAIFGDIYLEDLRLHRETQLAAKQIQAHFPLWQRNTRVLLNELIDLGFKAIVVAVDGSKLDASFVGRCIDKSFVNDLPADVDPCGENGEYHTFVFDGPNFSYPIPFELGEIVHKHYQAEHLTDAHPGFYFKELIPVNVDK
ncbi:diphthine--ammonia ligase [Thaumasiovibrio sp. DFM-14]|uniref:Dph6-related ATP pyrophosphatase n=1 Tax=Thaumasiovibrio sp. DFM-14 TaxID=3384792 RepID=UPI0039A19D36